MTNSMPQKQWDELWNKGVLKESDSKGATDWEMRYPSTARDTKYSSKMYSPSLQKLRHRTFSEFYGNGIVD